jgi:hypothetical protein
MAVPQLTPKQTTSAIALPESGTLTTAAGAVNYPLGVYVRSTKQDETSNELYSLLFVTGAAEQVNYTYRKLGGDVVDIELTEKNIFTAYEEAVLEYSNIVNLHQAKNVLGQALGNTTGSFDQRGQISGSTIEGQETLTDVSLRYPRFDFGYARQIADTISTEVGIGGTQPIYSGSIALTKSVQDYNLQHMLSQSSLASNSSFPNKIKDSRVFIRRVYYKTPHAMWRFYGYYGGLNAVGNLSSYGMYADDSTFEIVPVWQNKMQAMAYEDAIYTRNSHYSYEIKNNVIRIYPEPTSYGPSILHVEFSVQKNAWETDSNSVDKAQVDGVNNLNTLPFGPLPFDKINSMGKQWIRKYALALSKEMLGQVRGKFSTIPIPGESVTLNAADLLSQAKDEQDRLRTDLRELLDELTYLKLTEADAAMTEAAQKTFQTVPYFVYVG